MTGTLPVIKHLGRCRNASSIGHGAARLGNHDGSAPGGGGLRDMAVSGDDEAREAGSHGPSLLNGKGHRRRRLACADDDRPPFGRGG